MVLRELVYVKSCEMNVTLIHTAQYNPFYVTNYYTAAERWKCNGRGCTQKYREWNVIQNEKPDSKETSQNKWTDVITDHHKRKKWL